MFQAISNSTSEGEKCVQTELTSCDISAILESNNFVTEKHITTEKTINKIKLNLEAFTNNDAKTKYYTGLESFQVLIIVFNNIENHIAVQHNSALDKFQMLILTLMKLRLNLEFKDLAYRFAISSKTASVYFHAILEILYQKFKSLVFWPDRETVYKTMPSAFVNSFHSKTTVIIDCFEIFIEKPSKLRTAAQCWSAYKHHHTIKFLIAITPQGMICYISEPWGGRTSDKFITENSKFFDNVSPGDVILADRGFLIKDFVKLMCADIKMPAFTKNRQQLHPIEVEYTRSIAHVRIHVERIIGLIRNKFKIVRGPIPLTLINDISKIVHVCCSLINLCPGIVPP